MGWKEKTIVAFDTETTGSYPLSAEICEIGAVKWRDGKIIDEFQTLIRPQFQIPEEVIRIHGITNEMVLSSPSIEEKAKEFYDFLQADVVVAHHAPFDLGFMAHEFEKAELPLPQQQVVCSSLLSRAVFRKSPNHKLQTLISYLNIPQGKAHRALDDAKACLEVAIKAFEDMGDNLPIDRFIEKQGKRMTWRDYSIKHLYKNPWFKKAYEAIEEMSEVSLVYMGGKKPGQKRIIRPCGLVRNPNGDYLVAFDKKGTEKKKFYLARIRDIS